MAAIFSRPQCVKMYRSGKGAYLIITEGEGETDQITPRPAPHFLPHLIWEKKNKDRPLSDNALGIFKYGRVHDSALAIIEISDGLMLIGPLWTDFSEVLINIQQFSFKKWVWNVVCQMLLWRNWSRSHSGIVPIIGVKPLPNQYSGDDVTGSWFI